MTTTPPLPEGPTPNPAPGDALEESSSVPIGSEHPTADEESRGSTPSRAPGKSLLALLIGKKRPPKKNSEAGSKDSTPQEDKDAPERASLLRSLLIGSGKNKDRSKKSGKNGITSAMRRGMVYGGHRRYAVALAASLVGALVLSVLAIGVSLSKVSKSDLDAAVAQALKDQGAGFPSGQAVQWGGQVIRVTQTYDEKAASQHKTLVAPYLPAGMDDQAGWNGKGSQSVTFVSMNPNPRVLDASHAVVTGTYQTSSGTWACIDIPVFAYKPSTGGEDTPYAFTLSSLPTPTACAPRTGLVNLPSDGSKTTENKEAGETLSAGFFPEFFAAWAASDQSTLTQYLVDGVTTQGLGGAMESVPPPVIGDTTLMEDPAGKNSYAEVSVTWTVAKSTATFMATYKVPMKKVGAKWLVSGEPVPAYQSSNSTKTSSIPQPKESSTPEAYSNEQPSATPAPTAVTGTEPPTPAASPTTATTATPKAG